MQNKWLIETIAELAFVQEPIRFYGYGMEKGIILIADDDESALIIKSMLEAHLEAVGVKLRGRNENQPLNYQMGVHVYNRLDDERKTLDFLEEQRFLPIVITGGKIPEVLIGRGYAFRCTMNEKEFMEAGKKYEKFTDFTKREVWGVCDLIKRIRKFSDMLEDPQKKYQKYQKIVKNLITVVLIWKAVESRLWEFLNMDIARKNSLELKKGYANVISMEGLSAKLQRVWIELLLALLWRGLRTRKLITKGLWIFIDEFQNLSLKENSVLLEMLCEARKYHVNIVLATQSIAGYRNDIKAALDKTAVHLYFQQELTDAKKVASLIDVNKKGLWESKLKSLQIGESVAVGCFQVRRKTISHPIIIKSDFKTVEN